MSNVLIEESLEISVCEYFDREKTLKTVPLYFELAHLFNSTNLARKALSC